MDSRVIIAPVRYTFGFSHKDVVLAATAYLKKKGFVVNDGKTYAIGLERLSNGEGETLLVLVVDEMPDIMRQCEPNPGSMTVEYAKTSGRLPGQQKFVFSHRGVKEALSAFAVAYEGGRPLPDGPVTLWGLEEPSGGLTLFVDPS